MRKIYILKEAVSSEELVRDKYFSSWIAILRRYQVKEFYRKQQQIIENKEISIFSLSSKLEDLNLIDLIGGLDTLTDILDDYEGVQGFEEQIKSCFNKVLRSNYLQILNFCPGILT